LYVQAGIPANEALRIATWNGAKYTGQLDALGSVTPHKFADLILVNGDPSQNISELRKIALVMKEGKVFYPAEVYEALGVRRFVDPPRVELK
jgi:imidazolonepropionase-like amidohydrolase